MTSIYLPRFTIGEDAFCEFSNEMGRFGTKVGILYGEKAWAAAQPYVMPALLDAGFTVTAEAMYGKQASYENVERITSRADFHDADMILAVGGGKCIDTCKIAAERLDKPIFTVPTIASNCAPVTKISIMYTEDGVFVDIPRLKQVPVHCFIDPRIILKAPIKYFWAGIGDAMAKNVESEWSAQAGEALGYGSELGIMAGCMCFEPLLRDGANAMEDAKTGKVTEALENTLLNVIISPGITSVSVHPDYNGGIAHALFYGLTQRKHIEEEHLHGEVVSYGTLVNLMADVMMGLPDEKFRKTYAFNKQLELPVCLADLELTADDPLEDVLKTTMENQELKHTPYPVDAKLIYDAIHRLEEYKG